MLSTPLVNRSRDMLFFNSINNELVNRIITTEIIIYKINPVESESNIYGESLHKTYSAGVCMHALIRRDDQEVDTQEFGPNTMQNIRVAFHRDMLEEKGLYPETGDIVEFGEAYYELGNVIENQLVGGQYFNNFSIVYSATMASRDKLQIENIRVGSE